MGQKVNPHGLRVGVIKDWDSRWFVKDNEFGDTIVSDYNLRKYLKKALYAAGVPEIEIERDASRVRINLHCAKPGIVIGKGGAEIEKLRQTCEKMLGKPTLINIVEVRNPDVNAQLVAENIAAQLEKRISFRRAMKQCIARAMKLGAKGIKTQVSGRLGGAEIARTEQYHAGFGGLFRNGLIRENFNPNLAAALCITCHGDTGGFNLVGCDPCGFESNKAVIAIVDFGAASGFTGHTSSMDAAVFHSLR